MRNCCGLLIALAVLVTLMTAVTCQAQLYVVNDNNGRVISYVDTSGTILNTTETFGEVVGMAIEEDGTILVAEEYMIKRLDPDDGNIAVVDPYGYAIVDVYPAAYTTDIFTITGDMYPALNVMLGGVGPAEWAYGFIDCTPVDLQVYPIGDRAGNLIIMIVGAESASIEELVRTGSLTFVPLEPVAGSLTAEPAGFAITPDGDFIYLDHGLGMFEIDFGGNLTAFGPPGQEGWDHITIGSDGTVYVSDSVMNRIH